MTQLNYADVLDLVRRDRLRRTRRERFKAASAKFVGALIAGFVNSMLYGWLFMLAVGVIHHEWIPALPTLGYWWSVLIAWLIRGGLDSHSPATKREADR